jgi:hypothetical protein
MTFTRINKMGITILANMHHVDLAKKYSTRIIGIRAGQIVFDGKPSEVTDEVCIKIYGRSLNGNEKLGVIDDIPDDPGNLRENKYGESLSPEMAPKKPSLKEKFQRSRKDLVLQRPNRYFRKSRWLDETDDPEEAALCDLSSPFMIVGLFIFSCFFVRSLNFNFTWEGLNNILHELYVLNPDSYRSFGPRISGGPICGRRRSR